jgi:peptide deformylase
MNKTILPIVGYGSQILREPTIEAENNDESRKIMQALYDTINSLPTAVGLAAPQINSNLSMFIWKMDDLNISVINPRILKRRETRQSVESCLSIPGLSGSILRDFEIDVEFFDGHFNKHQMMLSGMNAIIFQHEYDHLNGIMYTDRMSRHGIQEISERLYELEKGKVRTYYDMIFFGPSEPVSFSPAPGTYFENGRLLSLGNIGTGKA